MTNHQINGGYAKGCGQMILFVVVFLGTYALFLLASAFYELLSAPPADSSLHPISRGDSTNSATGREAGY